MKKIFIILSFLLQLQLLYADTTTFDKAKPKITNNSNSTINIIWYSSKPLHKTDRQSRINDEGVTISAGKVINIPSNARGIAIYYGSKDPLITTLDGRSYTLYSSSDLWTLEAD